MANVELCGQGGHVKAEDDDRQAAVGQVARGRGCQAIGAGLALLAAGNDSAATGDLMTPRHRRLPRGHLERGRGGPAGERTVGW